MTTEERNNTIENNMNLVYTVIDKYFAPIVENETVLDKEDFFQAGCEGLIKAADTFDETRGFSFSTYACNVIRNSIIRMLKSLRPKEYTKLDQEMLSLNEPVKNQDGEKSFTYEDTVSDEESDIFTDDVSVRSSYMEILEYIESREKSITEEDIMMFDFMLQGYNPEDIAAETGIDRKHVNSRLFVLKRKIRAKYLGKFEQILSPENANSIA